MKRTSVWPLSENIARMGSDISRGKAECRHILNSRDKAPWARCSMGNRAFYDLTLLNDCHAQRRLEVPSDAEDDRLHIFCLSPRMQREAETLRGLTATLDRVAWLVPGSGDNNIFINFDKYCQTRNEWAFDIFTEKVAES